MNKINIIFGIMLVSFVLFGFTYAQSQNSITDGLVNLFNCTCFMLREILFPIAYATFALAALIMIFMFIAGETAKDKARPWMQAFFIIGIISIAIAIAMPVIVEFALPSNIGSVCMPSAC